MADSVLIERPAERVAHVILNRPERRNALTGPLAIELLDAIQTVDADPDLTVMILRGSGGAFCSGLRTSVVCGARCIGRCSTPARSSSEHWSERP